MFVPSVFGESPPPPQKIFGREGLVKNIVDLADTDHPTPIALIGTGGIGKTSVALAVLHDDRIKRRFGDHRRFLRCDQFSASLPNFLHRLSEVIGAGITNPADLTSLRPFLSRNRMLIIIDNAESIFGGPTTKDIDPVVEELSRFGNIWLCITSRASIIPTRCEVIDVPTLSVGAARETFHSIYRCEKSDAVSNILKQLDFHPLSVILLATAAKHNKWGIGQLEKEWEEQRTRVLRTRYHGSLAATIELSLRSPIFQDLGPHARDLLGVVAFFPQGINENNLDWLFPSIVDRKRIFGGFCVLSLTRRNKGFITMLAPLRDHLCSKDPMSASLLPSIKEYYFSRLSFSVRTMTPDNDRTMWIASEDANVEHLLDVLTSIDANSESAWDACWHFMIHLFLHKPRLPVFGPKVEALPDGYPSKPQCLEGLSSLCSVIGNSAGSRRLLSHALKLHRERGDDDRIASTLLRLAAIESSSGFCEKGIQQAREAMAIFHRLGNMVDVVLCLTGLSRLFRHTNRPDEADECEAQVIRLAGALVPAVDPVSRNFLHTSLAAVYYNKGDTEKFIFHSGACLGVGTSRTNRFDSHCTQAVVHSREGRFHDAEAHIEHARLLAAHGSSEPGSLMLVQAGLLQARGKFEEARSKALCALGSAEEFGSGDGVEEAKRLLRIIDEEVVKWASMDELRASLACWAEPWAVSLKNCGCNPPYLNTQIHSALGGDISQNEKISKAAAKLMALLEKDGNRPGGPNFFQITKAYKELATLLSHSNDKQVSETIAQRLAPTAVDEPDEMPSLESLMRQKDG